MDYRVSAAKVVKHIKADTHGHTGYKSLQEAILKELKDSVSPPFLPMALVGWATILGVSSWTSSGMGLWPIGRAAVRCGVCVCVW